MGGLSCKNDADQSSKIKLQADRPLEILSNFLQSKIHLRELCDEIR